jgi:hypothetical protein
MDSNLLENLISELMLNKISGQTKSTLSREFLKTRSYLQDINGFNLYKKGVQDFQNDFATKSGLFESWVSLTILSSFVAGFAAGRGNQVVTDSDVRDGTEAMCDRYPKCHWMRWYDII